jgi:hypothetical protein
VESISPTIWLPSFVFTALAFLMAFFSLSATSHPLSVALGIFAMTLLIDALELRRQQNRVRKGHAPANPANPRHTKILAQHATATTLDPLKRDTAGHPISAESASTNL